MRTHGIYPTYTHGCHCSACTQASTAYKAALRARQRAARDNREQKTVLCPGCLTELRSRGVTRHERACLT